MSDDMIERMLNGTEEEAWEIIGEIERGFANDQGFRELDNKEEQEFRQWARENYVPGTEISILWHPSVKDECRKMNLENNHV